MVWNPYQAFLKTFQKLAGETAPASRFGSLELQTRKGDGKRDFGVVSTVRASQTHQHVCFWDTKNDLTGEYYT